MVHACIQRMLRDRESGKESGTAGSEIESIERVSERVESGS